MSLLESLKELQYEVDQARSEATQAHWDWIATRDKCGKGTEEELTALAKKHAKSHILNSLHEEMEHLQEEIKHG